MSVYSLADFPRSKASPPDTALSHAEFARNQVTTANLVAELVRGRVEPETTFFFTVGMSLREGVAFSSTRDCETITGINDKSVWSVLNRETGVAVPEFAAYGSVSDTAEIFASVARSPFKPLSALAVDGYGAAMAEDIPKMLATDANAPPGEVTVYQPKMTLSDGRPVRLVWILRVTVRPGLHAYYIFNLINYEVRLAHRDIFKHLRELRRAPARNEKNLRLFAKAAQQFFQTPYFVRGTEGLGNSWLAGEFYGIFGQKLPFMDSVGRVALVKDETDFGDWFLQKLASANANPTPNLDRLAKRGALSIATPRLNIATARKEDLPELLPIFRHHRTVFYTWFRFDEGITRWTEASLRERFEWQASEELQSKRYDFVMRTNDAAATVIGRCALYRPEKHGDWEFGITIHEDHWKKGFGEETTRAVLDFAFRRLEAKNVYLEVLPENDGMQKVCKKMSLRLAVPSSEAEPSGPFQLRYDYYVLDREVWERQP